MIKKIHHMRYMLMCLLALSACITANTSTVSITPPQVVDSGVVMSLDLHHCDTNNTMMDMSSSSPDLLAPDLQPVIDLALLLLPLGAFCHNADTCASGYCANSFDKLGVCCNSRCVGGCMSCALEGKVGTCSPVAAGSSDPHSGCANQGIGSCGHNGLCNGTGGCESYKCDGGT